jgi:putative spermidine/putrescine transport system ATP-binding protein
MSDRIAVFARGRVRQLAAPITLYEQPADVFVATFIGESIRFRGKTVQRDGYSVRVTLAAGGDIGAMPVDIGGVGSLAGVIVRPERILLGEAASVCANCFRGRVADVIYHGDHLRVRLNALGSDVIVAKIANAGGPPPALGSDMLFGFRAEDARAFALEDLDA